MSLRVGDERAARWVKLLRLLGMEMAYEPGEHPRWSTATVFGERPTALAVVDVVDHAGEAEWDSVLEELFRHAAASSWYGDIWAVAAGRLLLPGLDAGWGPEFKSSGWIAQYQGDHEGLEGWAPAPAPWAHCRFCGGTVVFHPEQTFLCTPGGCYDSGDNFEAVDLDQLRMTWEEAAFGPVGR